MVSFPSIISPLICTVSSVSVSNLHEWISLFLDFTLLHWSTYLSIAETTPHYLNHYYFIMNLGIWENKALSLCPSTSIYPGYSGPNCSSVKWNLSSSLRKAKTKTKALFKFSSELYGIHRLIWLYGIFVILRLPTSTNFCRSSWMSYRGSWATFAKFILVILYFLLLL